MRKIQTIAARTARASTGSRKPVGPGEGSRSPGSAFSGVVGDTAGAGAAVPLLLEGEVVARWVAVAGPLLAEPLLAEPSAAVPSAAVPSAAVPFAAVPSVDVRRGGALVERG